MSRRFYLDTASRLYQAMSSGKLTIYRTEDQKHLEYDKAVALDVAMELAKPEPWYCYHCGFETSEKKEAAEHFGEMENFDRPVCVEANRETLQKIVSTNREMWVENQKLSRELEQAEFERDCWKQVGRKLTGKAEASWHDFAEDGAALYARETERRKMSENFLKHILREYMKKDPVGLTDVFKVYDPLLVPPLEYLESLERP